MSIYLNQVEREYKIGWIHNPKHFYQHLFNIEIIDGKAFLVGTPRDKTKNYRKVARLTPITKKSNTTIWNLLKENYHDYKNPRANHKWN